MFKKVMEWFDTHIRFEHMAVLGFMLSALVRIKAGYGVDDLWFTLAEAYVVLGGGFILFTAVHNHCPSGAMIVSWGVFTSGLLFFALVGPVPWVYYPAAFGAFLKTRWYVHGKPT